MTSAVDLAHSQRDHSTNRVQQGRRKAEALTREAVC